MDVYITNIRGLAGREDEALARLSAERRARALRFRFADDRLRCAAAGLLLRRFTGDAPLLYGPYGKPYREGGAAFSLSHSGELAVLALHTAPVGIDVEAPGVCRPAAARRVFQPEELRWMREAPDARFFFLWTRKEAVIKCLGTGFALAPVSFSVWPGDTARAEGRPFFLHTTLYAGHTLSAAAEDDAAFSPVFIPAETLLTP